MKKNILITGGTSGIGFNAAKTLVKNPENNLILIGKNIDKSLDLLYKIYNSLNNTNCHIYIKSYSKYSIEKLYSTLCNNKFKNFFF